VTEQAPEARLIAIEQLFSIRGRYPVSRRNDRTPGTAGRFWPPPRRNGTTSTAPDRQRFRAHDPTMGRDALFPLLLSDEHARDATQLQAPKRRESQAQRRGAGPPRFADAQTERLAAAIRPDAAQAGRPSERRAPTTPQRAGARTEHGSTAAERQRERARAPEAADLQRQGRKTHKRHPWKTSTLQAASWPT